MTTYSATVEIKANGDTDDCFADAVAKYVARYPSLAGWDLAPEWNDENDRTTVLLTVPLWHFFELQNLASDA